MTLTLPPRLRAHWFLCVLPLLFAADVFLAIDARGEVTRVIEAVLLFDLAVLLPCLYWLCYRRTGRKAAFKAVAIACLGIWVASKLVVPEEQQLIAALGPLRYLGLAVLFALEVVLLFAIYRSVFKGASVDEAAAQAQATMDMPPWVARLIALEARFWRSAWDWLKRWSGRR